MTAVLGVLVSLPVIQQSMAPNMGLPAMNCVDADNVESTFYAGASYFHAGVDRAVLYFLKMTDDDDGEFNNLSGDRCCLCRRIGPI